MFGDVLPLYRAHPRAEVVAGLRRSGDGEG